MINADELLKLVEAIYVARTIRDFKRESLLYRYLVRIFRSPETLIKVTRRKKPKLKND
jgi:hypothetical protein